MVSRFSFVLSKFWLKLNVKVTVPEIFFTFFSNSVFFPVIKLH